MRSDVGRSGLIRRMVAIGAVLAQIALLFLYGFAPGMIAGPPWTFAFGIAWLIELVATLVLAVRRPLAAPLVPATSFGLAVLALRLGEMYLGWTG